MRSVNDIFENRDVIIESMGFFNPLILEENNVVVTEGVVGGIVEKLKALFAMIKGWIDKLIDFIASKFGKGRKKKAGGGSDKPADSGKAKELSTAIKSTESDMAKEIAEARKKVAENARKRDIPACKAAIAEVKKKMSQYTKTLKEKQAAVTGLKNATVEGGSARIKLPDLKNAKNAVNDLINDCKKVMKSDDPYSAFKGKSIKSYFMKSERESELSIKQFLENKDYQSYTYEAGQDCIDQLRGYQKSVEETYKELESAAKSLPEPSEAKYYAIDKPKNQQAEKLLSKAKSINRMSQIALKGGVAILSNYVNKLTDFREKSGGIMGAGDQALSAAQKDLDDFRKNFIPRCRKELSDLEAKLARLEG